MTFNPKLLPPTLYEAYKKGPTSWVFVIKTAIELGIRNSDKLTDIVFYLHHPELKGRQLRVGETKLIESWKLFRFLIKLLVPISGKTPVGSKVRNIKQFKLAPIYFEDYKTRTRGEDMAAWYMWNLRNGN